jgi:hypothetical protein
VKRARPYQDICASPDTSPLDFSFFAIIDRMAIESDIFLETYILREGGCRSRRKCRIKQAFYRTVVWNTGKKHSVHWEELCH